LESLHLADLVYGAASGVNNIGLDALERSALLNALFLVTSSVFHLQQTFQGSINLELFAAILGAFGLIQ